MPFKSLATVGVAWSVATLDPACAWAATLEYSSFPVATVRDADANGVALSLTVSTAVQAVRDIRVQVTLEGAGDDGLAFNGDYYMRLTHADPDGQGDVAILLNRAGRREGDGFGYADNGFAVTFSDSGAMADVHAYRKALFGNDQTAIPASGMLTGIWAPDGRETDPAFVTDLSPRTATLSAFDGINPNGTWTLFVADLSSGGEGRIASWGLSFVPIPEPRTSATVVAALLMAGALCRRFVPRRRSSEPPALRS